MLQRPSFIAKKVSLFKLRSKKTWEKKLINPDLDISILLIKNDNINRQGG